MAKKLHSLEIRGKTKDWGFDVYVDPRYVEEWRADGIEIYEVCNTIPEWIADLGLARTWCIVQDLLQFKNPFK